MRDERQSDGGFSHVAGDQRTGMVPVGIVDGTGLGARHIQYGVAVEFPQETAQ